VVVVVNMEEGREALVHLQAWRQQHLHGAE
jgi:hypothetical protein